MDGMGVGDDYKKLAYVKLKSPKICTLQAVFSDWMRPTHIKKDHLLIQSTNSNVNLIQKHLHSHPQQLSRHLMAQSR